MDTDYCKVCNNLELMSDRSLMNVRHHRIAFDFTPVELLSAYLQCSYCCMLFEGIRQFKDEIGNFVDSVARIYARGPVDNIPPTLSLEIYFKESRPKLEIEFRSKGDVALHPIISPSKQSYQPREATSTESLLWVRSNISHCLQSHSRCSKDTEQLLPTRTLSIESLPDGVMKVRLCETKGVRGRYACLSHRWGGSEMALTTRATYANKLDGIPWAEIPKTFQDAITFAKSLEIAYIWIDSYCIVQDDDNDWKQESERMADVYRSSYITIAATVAQNNESGLFWPNDMSHEKVFQAELQGLSRTLLVRRVMQHWERVWTSNSESRFPLLTRAWVFQERLLAPRVVHFSHLELVWECNGQGDCQCGSFDNRSNAKGMEWYLNNSWRYAIELFSSLKLTRESDRLTALHGFATFYAPIVAATLEKDYSSGLWKHSLPLDLLWRVDPITLSSSSPPRLCRCWDSEISSSSFVPPGKLSVRTDYRIAYSSQLSKRCQYSYSAACSSECLRRRKLCRFGNFAAAISPYYAVNEVSCVDGKQSHANIVSLYVQERANPRSKEQSDPHSDAAPFPSWSWVSARSRVKYWHDLELKAYDYGRLACIDGTTIRATGKILGATLVYDETLELGSNDIRPHQAPGADEAPFFEHHHQILTYSVSISHSDGDGSSKFPFFPDSILCLEGPTYLRNFTPIFLFHVTSNVYLVLKEIRYDEEEHDDRDYKRWVNYNNALQHTQAVLSTLLHPPNDSREDTTTSISITQAYQSYHSLERPFLFNCADSASLKGEFSHRFRKRLLGPAVYKDPPDRLLPPENTTQTPFVESPAHPSNAPPSSTTSGLKENLFDIPVRLATPTAAKQNDRETISTGQDTDPNSTHPIQSASKDPLPHDTRGKSAEQSQSQSQPPKTASAKLFAFPRREKLKYPFQRIGVLRIPGSPQDILKKHSLWDQTIFIQ